MNEYIEPARLRDRDVVSLPEGPCLVELVSECNARCRVLTKIEQKFFVTFGGSCLIQSEGETTLRL